MNEVGVYEKKYDNLWYKGTKQSGTNAVRDRLGFLPSPLSHIYGQLMCSSW